MPQSKEQHAEYMRKRREAAKKADTSPTTQIPVNRIPPSPPASEKASPVAPPLPPSFPAPVLHTPTPFPSPSPSSPAPQGYTWKNMFFMKSKGGEIKSPGSMAIMTKKLLKERGYCYWYDIARDNTPVIVCTDEFWEHKTTTPPCPEIILTLHYTEEDIFDLIKNFSLPKGHKALAETAA